MTPTIDIIMNHRSVRHFTDQAVDNIQLEQILNCALAASSSSFMQCSSIIHISNPDSREKLAQYAGGQPYVASAAVFLVFCVDFNRHQQIHPQADLGYVEQTLIGSVDTGLMGQNALLAAESLGLGGVFIGGIRNNPQQVSTLLGLPKHVLPLFGLCIGYPSRVPEKKPRLPLSVVVHQEQYQSLEHKVVEQYDQYVEQYYAARSSNAKHKTWSQQITATLSKESRPFMQDFLKQQGFNLK